MVGAAPCDLTTRQVMNCCLGTYSTIHRIPCSGTPLACHDIAGQAPYSPDRYFSLNVAKAVSMGLGTDLLSLHKAQKHI